MKGITVNNIPVQKWLIREDVMEKKSAFNFDPEFIDSIKKVRENLSIYIELIQIQAQLHKEKYDALLREGFTEKQALELCKEVFMK